MKRNALAFAFLLINSACAIGDGAKVVQPCTESESLEYATTLISHVAQDWTLPNHLADVTCVLRVKQNKDGEVLDVNFIDCPEKKEVRDSLLAVLENAQPLPKPTNPSCFREEATWSLEPVSEDVSAEVETAPKWPSHALARKARRNVFDRRGALDDLVQKLMSSPYETVNQNSPGQVIARRSAREWDAIETPADPDAWSELLTASGSRFALRHNNQVHLPNLAEGTAVEDGVIFSYMYLWSKDYLGLECLPEYAEFDCGVCDESVGDSWNIVFSWGPADAPDWPEEDLDRCLAEFYSATGEALDSSHHD